MSLTKNLKDLIGEWKGTNRLHVPWMKEDPVRESVSNTTISLAAKDNFLNIKYDWIFEERKQDGLIILGGDKNLETIKSVWIDSWHSSNDFLTSEGKIESNETISVKGFYQVQGHPDWGWRTVIKTESKDSFKITMYNVSPEGEESLAVECEFNRL